MFPIRPGERNFLSGSMGELRRNHFHGGIDVKTYGEIGLPIHSSAEGYVSRISVSPVGYGKRIAVTHPNGFVTHYAHLNHFSDRIEEYVLDKQYANQKFVLEVFPNEGEIKVEKGEIIGFSGNSGSSGGPHLHYEIRDTEDNVYNPLDFGFDEIRDNVAPRIYKIALKPLDEYGTVEGSYDKKYYKLGFLNGRYVVNKNLWANGLIGLEVKAYDKMNGTRNMYGIQEIQVWLDGVRHYEQKIDFYPILNSRKINLHVAYDDVHYRGDWYQKCYVTPGNNLPFYKYQKHRGGLNIEDGKQHEIQVFIKDSYGNRSLLEFMIEGRKPKAKAATESLVLKPKFSYELEGTILKMELENVGKNEKVELYSFYNKKVLNPVVSGESGNIYTYRMTDGIPDSVRAADTTYVLPYRYMLLPEKQTEYYGGNLKLNFGEGILSDTLFLKHTLTDSTLRIHESHVPVFGRYMVEWKVDDPKLQGQQLYQKHGRSLSYLGKNWKNDAIQFYPKSFGTFVFAQDTVPPTVRMIYNTGEEMKLRIRDNLSGIRSYDVYVNDRWILMEYDAKRNMLTSKLRDGMPSMRGNCLIKIEDNAGNVKEINLEL